MYFFNLYVMKKRKERFFKKDVYLLGIGQDGRYLWLEEPVWYMETYWGFGYVEVYTDHKNPQLSLDFCVHTHWDVLHFKNPDPFTVSTFSMSEYEKLKYLFNRYYLLFEASKIFRNSNGQRSDLYNKKHIPQILNQILNIIKP